MRYDGKVFREDFHKAIKKSSGCPTKKPTKDLLSLDFTICAVGRQNHIKKFIILLTIVRLLLDRDFEMRYKQRKIPTKGVY